jgi:hypothetical protein
MSAAEQGIKAAHRRASLRLNERAVCHTIAAIFVVLAIFAVFKMTAPGMTPRSRIERSASAGVRRVSDFFTPMVAAAM